MDVKQIKMKLIIFLSVIPLVYSRSIQDNEENICDGVNVKGEYHSKEVLKTDLDRPYLLSVDYGTNTLYFSYSIDNETDEFQSAYIDLNTLDFDPIENIQNGFAQAVDQKTHDVYIGGSDGIYKFDHKTKKAERYAAHTVDVWMVYFKDMIYYSVFPSQFLYTFQDGEYTRFKDLEDTKVDHMVIDSDDNVFFTNDSGIYAQKKGSKDAVAFGDNVSNVRGLATDINGNPYACLEDGIYILNKAETKLEKIADVDGAFGLAFDNENNIIYADSTSLNRLKPSKRKDCVPNVEGMEEDNDNVVS